MRKCIGTDGGIADPAGEVEQGVRALSRIRAGIASVRCWTDRKRVLDERKADEGNCD